MTDRMLRAHTRAAAAVRRVGYRLADDHGDVPGWVLITLMTAALVTGIWAIAGEQLKSMFSEALAGVTGPDDVR